MSNVTTVASAVCNYTFLGKALVQLSDINITVIHTALCNNFDSWVLALEDMGIPNYQVSAVLYQVRVNSITCEFKM